MTTNGDRSVTKGMLAGMLGGLIAAWAMNQFQAAMSKAAEAWEKSAHRQQPAVKNPSENDAEDATMKTADRLALVVLNRHLSEEEKKKTGPVIHYAFGSFVGAVYGGLAEMMPLTTIGQGGGYGAAIWLLGDEIVVPKLGLSKPPQEYPAKVHAQALAAHLVYGVTADTVRRGVRAVL
jgi:putative membrane protein